MEFFSAIADYIPVDSYQRRRERKFSRQAIALMRQFKKTHSLKNGTNVFLLKQNGVTKKYTIEHDCTTYDEDAAQYRYYTPEEEDSILLRFAVIETAESGYLVEVDGEHYVISARGVFEAPNLMFEEEDQYRLNPKQTRSFVAKLEKAMGIYGESRSLEFDRLTKLSGLVLDVTQLMGEEPYKMSVRDILVLTDQEFETLCKRIAQLEDLDILEERIGDQPGQISVRELLDLNEEGFDKLTQLTQDTEEELEVLPDPEKLERETSKN
ncbi:hypothetical protein ACFL0U_03465 [Pseudomonadota bacterium]